MAQTFAAASQGAWNPCRENSCRTVRRRSQRRRLAQVRTYARIHQPQAAPPQRSRPLPVCTPSQSHRPAVPCRRSLPLSVGRSPEKCRTGAHRLTSPLRTRPSSYSAPVTLSRFRLSPRYQGRPAAADMAFCIAACAQGWSESEITAALCRDYLSRDQSPTRQFAYIRRTLIKAIRWVA